ncbi:class I SAM-dependent methyltransferase [Bremerella alba]|uniref:Class I SAM-dependent methyltransferase n=1 Tax=Bremerella alba TaxID=980252 RepID=A0A7V8V135_9BACT|nr:class I SAM-dependent methyltransferase [Bremerella alba]MBA2112901.1 hypothetical protein [Bremerella alba]
MKWLKRIRDKARRRIRSIRQSIYSRLTNAEQRREIKELQDELFSVPPLPPIQFLSDPLANWLSTAREEMSEFLAEEDGISDEEHQYLLMQMFFRGPVDKIREEQREILDSIEVDESIHSLPVWDLGCGRGELLQVLNEAGFRAVGIDKSALMIKKMKDLGLEALHGDAIDELQKTPDGSLCGITAFHVIEHMPFEVVLELLRASYQKLAPGGFLLLETPNPFCFESLSFFHTDQTHVRPIQPYQLAFLVETAGFADTRLHFTAPVPTTRRHQTHNFMQLYQNHGIVAKKPLASDACLKKVA